MKILILKLTLIGGDYFVELRDAVDFIKWCYENHLDVNGLIPKDLANDATNLNIY